ncbi:CidA/LrgA family protein [Clostridium chauvoei]|uniref:CidA/LrgA family protein n=2 Tax=Clostridium chauvoei TaxID=46867 RepID=A0ABD4RH58_9CLOT|nr:CidA/LrgA family protein [Clostridium chauvoei]ATD55437.1 CidA/LrgA family protein [Clostridium chauvoei]ATD56891.1 CidA/LrgA family protein [Clostridium chauvoei]MBX7280729.1 CidA/LrgA family protein [Clostridium chauvoei]MBX7283212.1 CidA/LrgA family protein [Clostridium chauvoei]MBX7285903.1 CidA/LrgA family protein [Clostridium chauvoei]
MKLFRQSIIILGIYLLGELISKGLGLPVPGNIIGMLLLLLLLCTNVIKVESVETVSNFFLDHLAFFFIPAGVGLLTSFDNIKSSLIKIVLICAVATAIVIVVTGLVVQVVSNTLNKKKNGSEEI